MKRLLRGAYQVRCYSAPAERSIPVSKQKYVPTSGTYPRGFLAGTAHAGVKASNTKYDDVALVVSEAPAVAAGLFTRNVFSAAPVQVSRNILNKRSNGFHGVIVNSGCANAVTGKAGNHHAYEMVKATDKCFGGLPNTSSENPESDADVPRTLVMSTGVIGQQLPFKRLKEAIPKAHASLNSSHESWLAAAQAICTTDTFPKLLSRTFKLPSDTDMEYRIAGMTKGAGMIHPNMGTLLAIVCTDVAIHPGENGRQLLKSATNRSFNCISIDGDTSTNDTVVLLANGAAAPPDATPITYHHPRRRNPGQENNGEDAVEFRNVLTSFMQDLAKLCVRDGEGATKFVTIRVQSTHSKVAARQAASSIAKSPLVKTALYGKDANWGRILCAVGYAPGIMDDPGRGLYRDRTSRQVHADKVSVSFLPADGSEPLPVFVLGEAQQVDEPRAKEILDMEDIEILVKMDDVDAAKDSAGQPEAKEVYEATYWTCDFSHEYVTINGDYRT